MTENQLDQLDTEFNEDMQKIEKSISNYSFREKSLLTEWIAKLKASKSSDAERELRNRFAKYINNSFETNSSIFNKHPFNSIPANFNEPLEQLKHMLPKSPDEALNPTEDEKRLYISELFSNLPDKGKFLSQQPVPREGTFFIFISAIDNATNNPENS